MEGNQLFERQIILATRVLAKLQQLFHVPNCLTSWISIWELIYEMGACLAAAACTMLLRTLVTVWSLSPSPNTGDWARQKGRK